MKDNDPTIKRDDLINKLNNKIQSFTYILNKEHKCEGIKEIKKDIKGLNSEKNLINAPKQ